MTVAPPPARSLVATTIAIVLLATILRGPIVAISPVIASIESDLGISASVAGLLTSIPVLCFAVATPVAVGILRRGGTVFTVAVCLVGVLAGWVIRSLGSGLVPVLLGTLVLGVAITVGNVVVPVLIRREYPPARVGVMTGVYISAINLGSMVAALGTAPLEPSLGWRGAVLSSAAFGVAAVAVWLATRGWRAALVPAPAAAQPPSGGDHPLRVFGSATVWILALAFGGQTFSYYSVTAWLPSLLSDELNNSAVAAGGISSIFQLTAVVGGIGAPLLARRIGNARTIALMGALWLAVPLGFLFAPGEWGLWTTIGGIAQGGGITMVLVVAAGLGRTDQHAASVTGLVQAVGYAIAAVAPTAVGAAHDATGHWNMPLVVVLVAVLVFGTFGSWGASRAHRAHL